MESGLDLFSRRFLASETLMAERRLADATTILEQTRQGIRQNDELIRQSRLLQRSIERALVASPAPE